MKENPGIKTKLKNYFITGLLVLIPISLTIYILKILIKMVGEFSPIKLDIPGLELLITIGIVLGTGFIAKSVFGSWLVNASENLLYRIPIVKNIYQGTKQLSNALFAPKGDKFRSVVLLEYPRKGIYSLGFVTGDTKGAIEEKTVEKMYNVFVPTTPNPTSGFYLMVPENEVVTLDMNIEEAFKILISGGLYHPPKQKTSPPSQ